MIRILLAEDNKDYRGLIERSLPDCDVDGAATYDEAAAFLEDGALYDAAIVDLNLVAEGYSDKLGEKLLAHMKERYPWIARIALTGMPPGTVKRLFKRYDLADLLLKRNMELSDVGRVIEEALTNSPDGPSLAFRSDRGKMWARFIEWRGITRQRFIDRARTLELDLGGIERATQRGRELADALAALELRKASFETDCLDTVTILVSVRDEMELKAAAGQLATLRAKYLDLR